MSDRERVRRSAAQIGLWTGIASTIIIMAGAGILTLIVLGTSREEGRPPMGGEMGDDMRRPGFDDLVVNVNRVLPVIVVLGILGIVLVALIAWAVARRAVGPLGEALTAQRTFVADASHELRTPLTAINSRIQILQRRLEHGDDPASTIQALRRESQAMDDILTELLLTAEGDAVRGRCDLAAVASDTVARFAQRAADAGVTLTAHAAGAAPVALAEVTAGRLCAALIDNAIEHSPAATTVTVTVTTSAHAVALRVSDQGSGLPTADRERIFERFARGPERGQRRSFGLGLAIVRDITDRAHGRVEVESTSPAGTTFLVTLPAGSPAAR